ncbi:hypothetical protein RHSIM_Rhsim02G0192100 [Rhododendron simsii]|uniref:Uncharacterized protein n=1 Tax=Rhododendron simsii TaxID=118357 RepID=A0A834HD41_RHOSS|nr:hypothetical protein RHSIM_Rhsim02G0192100 [Rhododendron simsii]
MEHLKLLANFSDPILDPSSYRRLIRHRIYLTISRLDITFTVNLLNQFMHTPRVPHFDTAVRILRYREGSGSHGLLFSSSSALTLIGYTDSNWASSISLLRFGFHTMGATLINSTRRDIEIREFLVVDPTEHPGNIYSSVIRLTAGATKRVDGRRKLRGLRERSLNNSTDDLSV